MAVQGVTGHGTVGQNFLSKTFQWGREVWSGQGMRCIYTCIYIYVYMYLHMYSRYINISGYMYIYRLCTKTHWSCTAIGGEPRGSTDHFPGYLELNDSIFGGRISTKRGRF